jgi:hypothetical protein
MPIIRALTPQLAQRISLSGPILKPSDRLLIVVSKFLLSFSSHLAEPFSAHTGHVTDVTNRSSFAIAASLPNALCTGQDRWCEGSAALGRKRHEYIHRPSRMLDGRALMAARRIFLTLVAVQAFGIGFIAARFGDGFLFRAHGRFWRRGTSSPQLRLCGRDLLIRRGEHARTIPRRSVPQIRPLNGGLQ